MVFEIKQTEKAAPLFEGWQETLIWSSLQKVMGTIYGDSAEEPTAAMSLVGDFSFYAGKPNRELVCHKKGAGCF